MISRLYRNVASELGFDEFHLYLRPVQFDVAEQKHQAEQKPVFFTAVLEGDSSVDRSSSTLRLYDTFSIGHYSCCCLSNVIPAITAAADSSRRTCL